MKTFSTYFKIVNFGFLQKKCQMVSLMKFSVSVRKWILLGLSKHWTVQIQFFWNAVPWLSMQHENIETNLHVVFSFAPFGKWHFSFACSMSSSIWPPYIPNFFLVCNRSRSVCKLKIFWKFVELTKFRRNVYGDTPRVTCWTDHRGVLYWQSKMNSRHVCKSPKHLNNTPTILTTTVYHIESCVSLFDFYFLIWKELKQSFLKGPRLAFEL